MDPKVLMELSQIVQQLPRDQLSRMQSLMHNMMAGFDVKKDMEEFEKTLPPGFREKLTTIMLNSGMDPSSSTGPQSAQVQQSMTDAPTPSKEMNLREARLTILRGVADGGMSPEDAERLLFPD